VANISETEFGTSFDYLRAFRALWDEGILEKHLALLQAHLAAPEHTVSWAQLARAVDYQRGSAVNLHYGKLAKQVARQLGLREKPRDIYGNAWWLWVLVRWAKAPDPDSGHTRFVLRAPVVAALRELGLAAEASRPAGVEPEALALWPDELDIAGLREGQRRQVWVNAYERNREARRQCIAFHGARCVICDFDFGEVYGELAAGFIHVHHLTPLAEIASDYQVDPVADLRPVCPNCHAVLHLGGRCRTIEEVRQLLRRGA
jgi:predicted HNH restriction endonuclease